MSLFRQNCLMMNNCFTLYPKTTTTWNEMDLWLTVTFLDGDDYRWDWRSFGNIGTENFQVVVIKKSK